MVKTETNNEGITHTLINRARVVDGVPNMDIDMRWMTWTISTAVSVSVLCWYYSRGGRGVFYLIAGLIMLSIVRPRLNRATARKVW